MDKKFRAAVIGRTKQGDYGHGLDVVWLEVPNVEIVGVADEDEAGRAAAAKRLKIDRTFADWRKMLDEVKPDVVSIASRWIDKHHEMALVCAERGIHMYIEKPLCRTLAEADELVAACERTHTRLAIACQTRYSPKLALVKKLIADGKIGRVLEYRGRGKEDQRGGCEDLWVLGTHVLDMVRYLAGHPQWCFASITQQGRPIDKKDVIDGAEGLGPLAGDAVNAMYGFADGATAYFASHRNAAKKGERFGLQIFGETGVIELLMGYLPAGSFLADSYWSPGRTGKAWQKISSAGIGLPEPIEKGEIAQGNVVAVKDLLASIGEHREPLGGIYEARGALELVHAVFDAHRQGKAVKLPLENRKHALTML